MLYIKLGRVTKRKVVIKCYNQMKYKWIEGIYTASGSDVSRPRRKPTRYVQLYPTSSS